MNIKNFFNIPEKTEVNLRLLLVIVVLSFVTIAIIAGGLIYVYQQLKRGAILESEPVKIEIGIDRELVPEE